MSSLSAFFSKIWSRLKKNITQRKIYRDGAQRLLDSKQQVLDLFKGADKVQAEKYLNKAVRYFRNRAFIGSDFHRFFPQEDPRLRYTLFALYAGIDLDNEIQETNDTWMLDDIKLSPHPGSWLMRLEAADIIFPSYFRRHIPDFEHFCTVATDYVRLCETREGPYELGHVQIEPGDVVFDCGANVGMFSAVASRYGAGQVYAFEALPELAKNNVAKVSALNGRIETVQAAVWDEDTTLSFSLVPNDYSSSRVDQLLSRKHHQQDLVRYDVPAVTLDSFVEKRGINRVDFIKADIEGAERNMLRGARRILREFAPKLSICTYHLPDDPQVLRELILEANPNYHIVEYASKMYAHVPKTQDAA